MRKIERFNKMLEIPDFSTPFEVDYYKVRYEKSKEAHQINQIVKYGRIENLNDSPICIAKLSPFQRQERDNPKNFYSVLIEDNDYYNEIIPDFKYDPNREITLADIANGAVSSAAEDIEIAFALPKIFFTEIEGRNIAQEILSLYCQNIAMSISKNRESKTEALKIAKDAINKLNNHLKYILGSKEDIYDVKTTMKVLNEVVKELLFTTKYGGTVSPVVIQEKFN